MADDGKMIVVAALGVLGGPWLFFRGFNRMKLRNAVRGTPTSKVISAAMGKVELKGLAKEEARGPLIAPFSGRPCAWFRWLVEEERKDSKGNSSWHSIGEGSSVEPFLLDDGSGKVTVHPQGAEVEAPKMLTHSSGMFSGKAPAGPQVAHWMGGTFSRRRRLSEWRIDLQRPIYALGMLRPPSSAPGDETANLGQGRNGEPFFISTDGEEALLSSLFWRIWGYLVGGAGAAVAGAAYLVWRFAGH